VAEGSAPPSRPRRTASDPRESRLRFVLAALPEVYRPQPVEDLLAHLLRIAATLAGASTGFMAAISDEHLLSARGTVEGMAGLAAPVAPADTPLLIRAVRGPGELGAPLSSQPQPIRETVLRSIFRNQTVAEPGGLSVPLRLGLHPMGALGLTLPEELDAERVELLEMLMAQGAAAMQNLVLYAADAGFVPSGYRYLTMQRLLHALRMSHRRAEACAVVYAELAGTADITREHGPRLADWVRHHWAQTLRAVVRDTDTVGRITPDGFLLILPATPAQGAEVLVRRLEQASLCLHTGEVEVPYRVNLGIAALPGLSVAPVRIGGDTLAQLAEDVVAAARAAASSGERIARCTWQHIEGTV
jgi:GGDEF domain-containing protein